MSSRGTQDTSMDKGTDHIEPVAVRPKVDTVDGPVENKKEDKEDLNHDTENQMVPHDVADMRRLGKQQELKRNFRWLPTLAFTTVIMATWETLLIVNTNALTDGGRPGMFYSYIWTVFGFAPIVMSLAEMSSMAPTSGGQYHWVSEFAPRKYQKFLSYMAGWMSVLSWQSNLAASGYVTASVILSLIGANQSGPDPSDWTVRWEQTVIAVVCLCVVAATNIWGSRLLAPFQYGLLFLHTAGFIILIALLWALPSSHVSARDVFSFNGTENAGGWKTMGLALMVGQISAAYALINSDAAAHLSETVNEASLTVPRSMFWSFIINSIMGFAFLITFLFAIPSVNDALNYSGFEFFYVFTTAMSTPAVNGVVVIGIVLLFGGNLNINASTSLQSFAFARDKGLPFSPWISKVTPKSKVQRNAIIISLAFAIVLNLINLASTAAFQAMISLQLGSIMISYFTSISCVLYRRINADTQPALPPARWSLGKWGPLVNATGAIYSFFVFFWSFWPTSIPVNNESMNWAALVFAVVFLVALFYYFWRAAKPGNYEGPVVDVDRAGHPEDIKDPTDAAGEKDGSYEGSIIEKDPAVSASKSHGVQEMDSARDNSTTQGLERTRDNTSSHYSQE